MRIAVIGNGPGPKGKGLGPEIDACDLVVRLHDCHYQTEPDYGTAYDRGVLPGPWLGNALPKVRRQPRDGWWIYMLHDGRVDGPAPERSQVVDFTVLNARARIEATAPSGRHASLSRGFCAIAATMRAHAGARVWCLGFDALFAADGADVWPHSDEYEDMARNDMADHVIYRVTDVHHDAAWELARLHELAVAHGAAIENLK